MSGITMRRTHCKDCGAKLATASEQQKGYCQFISACLQRKNSGVGVKQRRRPWQSP